jgi:hypothetical protein
MGTGENAGVFFLAERGRVCGIAAAFVANSTAFTLFANLSEFGGVCRQWEERFSEREIQ